MRQQRGGISIFLAIIFLSLIVFSCSIVEVTRYRIAVIQAERAVLSATQSVLGAYDTTLKNHYGIFARDTNYFDLSYTSNEAIVLTADPLSKDLEYYINEHITNNPNDLETSLIDQYIIKKDNKHNNLIEVELIGTKAYYPEKLFSGDEDGIEYVKEDILKFMDLRAPVLLLEPLVEKLIAVEKMGKTSSFIAKKNKQIKAAAKIETKYIELYTLIEGVIINSETGTMTTVDDELYVKGFSGNYGSDYYDDDYIVDKPGEASIINQLNGKVLNSKLRINEYLASTNSMIIEMEQLKSHYKDYNQHMEEIETLKKQESVQKSKESTQKGKIESLESDLENEKKKEEPSNISTIEDNISTQKEKLKKIKTKIKTIGKDIEREQEDLEKSKRNMTSDMGNIDSDHTINMRILEALKKIATNSDNYLLANEKAKELIESIRGEVDGIGEKIDTFIDEESAYEDDYISSTYNSSIDELETIKMAYGQDESDDNYESIGNLKLMLDVINGNIEILESQKDAIEGLATKYPLAIAGEFEKAGLSETDVIEINKLVPSVVYETSAKNQFGKEDIELTDIISRATEIENKLEDYDRDLEFDYSRYNQSSDVSDKTQGFVAFYENLKETIAGMGSDLLGEIILEEKPIPDGVPSKVVNLLPGTAVGAINTSYGEEDGENQYLEQSDSLSGIMTFASNARELLFLNEYAVGMFSSYPEIGQGVETLAGYPKDDHVLETELEYIYTGLEDPNKAVLSVASQIFTIRVLCNIGHIAASASKRTFITSIANVIAGWWSLGIGTIIVSILITLVWATAESFIDVALLLKGRKVPLLKMSSTWYLSLDGDKTPLIDEGIEVALDLTGKLIGSANTMVTDAVTKLSGDITAGTKEVAVEQINEIYNQGIQMTDALVESFENTFYEGIEAYVRAYKKGMDVANYASDYFDENTVEWTILKEALGYIDSYLGLHGVAYKQLIEAKEAAVDKVYDKIEAVKNTITDEVTSTIENQMEKFTTGLNDEITKLSEEGKEAAADHINKYAEAFKKEYAKEVIADHDKSLAGKTGVKLTDFLPSLSYQDYIRLFMMMKHNETDDRVLRMLDMIEMNMNAHRKLADSSLTYMFLSDFTVSVGCTGSFKINYAFFDLDVLKRKVDKTGSYTFDVSVVNAYE